MQTAMMNSTFHRMIDSSKPVLLDFYADWCGPSQLLRPELDKLKSEIGSNLKIVKINIESHGDLVDRLDIQSIPTLLLFHKGKLKWRASGVKSIPKLKRLIQGLSNR